MKAKIYLKNKYLPFKMNIELIDTSKIKENGMIFFTNDTMNVGFNQTNIVEIILSRNQPLNGINIEGLLKLTKLEDCVIPISIGGMIFGIL